jgi:hypothetical protein
MNTEMKSELQNAFRVAGYDCRSYSGRGMFGKYCLGITTEDSCVTVLLNILEHKELIAKFSDNFQLKIMLEAFSQFKTDAIGKTDTIIYFPSISYFENEEDEEGESDK